MRFQRGEVDVDWLKSTNVARNSRILYFVVERSSASGCEKDVRARVTWRDNCIVRADTLNVISSRFHNVDGIQVVL